MGRGPSLSLPLSIIIAKLNGSFHHRRNIQVVMIHTIIGYCGRAESIAKICVCATWLLEYFRQLAACHRILVRPAEGWAIMLGGGRRSPVGLLYFSFLFFF
ncbi:hypothetical protein BDV39DRAFT_185582 [Aspergillus sergii]|uniref:Uncharacterized protein n=1 Tax=Aspergillus sergii TaxID=1034303 RepID=A0A5N6WNX1_9EURO|nr:hypothetical protein BDV39DRAFT_185582 [Aspergillus sergii]